MKNNVFNLTPREIEVMHQLIEGKNNHEIAESIGASQATVKFHLGNIYYKMQVANRFEAFVKWTEYYD
jgi:DNA-binding NarL/FixJ family response regulator